MQEEKSGVRIQEKPVPVDEYFGWVRKDDSNVRFVLVIKKTSISSGTYLETSKETEARCDLVLEHVLADMYAANEKKWRL